METPNAYDPTVAVAPVVEVQAEMSMADLLEAAKADTGTAWVEGDYKLRLTKFSWHYSDNDKLMGLINSARGGCAKVEYTVVEGPGNTTGKTYSDYFHFKSGVTNGFRWDGEKDLAKWLIAQGIDITTMIQPVLIDGVRMCKDTYSPILSYVAQFGGDYTLRMTKHKVKEGEFNTRYTKHALLFDEAGQPLQRPLPEMPTVAPAPVPVAQPVVEQAPAIPVPVPVPAPVADVPVAPVAVAPVVPTPVPVQPVAVAQPVVPVPVVPAPVAVPVPVAEVPVVPAPAPVVPTAPVPTGLPTGLPGLPA